MHKAKKVVSGKSRRKKPVEGLYRKKGFPRTPFLMPDRSPWPIYAAATVYGTFIGLATYFNEGDYTPLCWTAAYGTLIITCWGLDMVVESVYRGQYTWEVQRACRHGFCLFMLREWMFFVRFF